MSRCWQVLFLILLLRFWCRSRWYATFFSLERERESCVCVCVCVCARARRFCAAFDGG